jgi:hypothetical protein
MKKYTYIDIYTDPKEFDKASAYWDAVVRRAIARRFDSEKWHSWFNRCFADGTLSREGTPMTSYVSQIQKKGIAVYSFPVGNGAVQICAEARIFGEGDTEAETPFLSITAIVSDRATLVASRLIKEWIKPSVTTQSMRRFIKSRHLDFWDQRF